MPLLPVEDRYQWYAGNVSPDPGLGPYTMLKDGSFWLTRVKWPDGAVAQRFAASGQSISDELPIRGKFGGFVALSDGHLVRSILQEFKARVEFSLHDSTTLAMVKDTTNTIVAEPEGDYAYRLAGSWR